MGGHIGPPPTEEKILCRSFIVSVLQISQCYPKGKGVKIRGWKPQVSTLLCPCRVGKPMLNVCKACVLTQFLLTVPCKNHIIKMYVNRKEIMKMIV